MPTTAKRSLNRRLWLIVVLAVVPLLIIVLLDYQAQRRAEVDDVRAHIESTLFAARQAEQSAQQSVQVVLEIVARADNMQTLNGGDCSALARRLLASLPHFANLGAAYPHGALFCSGQPTQARISVADRAWFREGLHSKDITAGEYVGAGRVSGRPAFVFGYPLRDGDDNDLLAVLFASLRIDWFDRVIADYNLPGGWEASLITSDGQVVAGDLIETEQGQIPERLMKVFGQALEAQQRIVEVAESAGPTRLYGVEPVASARDAEVFVAIGAPLELSLSRLNREFMLRVGVLLVVALLSALLARYIIYTLIDRWTGKMLATLDALASGRLDTRVRRLSDVRELERLERGINRMAEQLETREAALRRLSLAVEQSPACIMITDAQARIEYVNEATCATLGYSREELVGRTPRIFNGGHTPSATYAQLWQTLSRGTVWRGEFHNTRKDGGRIIQLATVAPVKADDGRVTHYVSVQEDITLRRRSEELLHQMAYNDALTGLPNRAMLRDRLQQATRASARTRAFAMLMHLDVDRFSELNDTIGHDAADALLQQVADRLRAGLREGDTIARQGDDDFAAICENLGTRREEAVSHAERLVTAISAALAERYRVPTSGDAVHATVSIGVTVFRGNQLDAGELLKQAEVALYRAKNAGRDCVRFFSLDMQERVQAHAALVRNLREALAAEAFSLHYQPQFDLDGRLSGAEALIRWRDAADRFVPPGEFIPVAEESGLIVPIGQWVLDKACARLKQWQAEAATRHIRLAVNVSARQFRRPEFVSEVQDCLERHDVDPQGLELELTESVVLHNLDEAAERMRQVRALGVRFALDDFGTGYSSLSYLRTLSFDKLKIDRTFIQAVNEDGSGRAIVRAIIALGQALSLEVVAEGVETAAQFESLRCDGCRFFQGYLFSTPLPGEVLVEQSWFPR